MPVTDRREPGVYVTIEDASYAAPPLEVGRTVYGVILCEKGPHNQVVTITSQSQFHRLFGLPDFRKCSQTVFQIDKALQYTGKVLVCRVVPTDTYWGNICIIENELIGNGKTETYTFAADNTVIVDAPAGYDLFDVGDWIYSASDSVAEARQIVSKNDDGVGNQTYTLDQDYEGTPGSAEGFLFVQFSLFAESGVSAFNTIDHETITTPGPPPEVKRKLYHFYANGAGTYYNNIILKGSRNTELEKYYVHDDADADPDNFGSPLYPYMFLNLGVYQLNDNGTTTLLEGPWPVSLIPRYPTGEQVRDLTSGAVLYIEEVINNNSDIIRCLASKPVSGFEPQGEYDAITEHLITDADAADNRLQVMLLFAESTLTGTNAIGSGGVQFEEGTNGTGMYDSGGNLNPDSTLQGIVKQAYNGSLTSIDGSVEQLKEVTYPWFEPKLLISLDIFYNWAFNS